MMTKHMVRTLPAWVLLICQLGNSNGWTTTTSTSRLTSTSTSATCVASSSVSSALRRRQDVRELRGLSQLQQQQQLKRARTSMRSGTVALAATVQNLPTAPGLPRELDELSLFESRSLESNDNISGGSNGCSSNSTATINTMRNQMVERVSIDPPIFIWRNALTSEQCLEIRESASSGAAMERGKTVTCKDEDRDDENSQEQNENQSTTKQKKPRRFSNVGWLSNEIPSVESIARNGHGVFLNGMPFHATRGIEPLQVVHYYDVGGEYINHHDGNNRLLTVLYYLNGVGETWFPLANSNDREGDRVEIRDATAATLACRDKLPGRDGVLVTCRRSASEIKYDHPEERRSERRSGPVIARVQEGDAVAFYNYNMDGSMNWKAFHSGLPITQTDLLSTESEGDGRSATTNINEQNVDDDNKVLDGAAEISRCHRGKWIANHFYHFVPSYVTETSLPSTK